MAVGIVLAAAVSRIVRVAAAISPAAEGFPIALASAIDPSIPATSVRATWATSAITITSAAAVPVVAGEVISTTGIRISIMLMLIILII